MERPRSPGLRHGLHPNVAELVTTATSTPTLNRATLTTTHERHIQVWQHCILPA